MTYGDNSRVMRDSMASLLHHHRILQRLGGPGIHTVKAWTTEYERERMGQIIQRYRLATLTWCLQAVTAATPKTDLRHKNMLTRDPAEDLRYRLGEAVTAVGHSEPLVDLLATPHNNDLMDAWQRIARAAAVGEHDFPAGVNLARLTPEQSGTVLKDAADITQALVILDKRYSGVPGWQHLTEARRLGRAAEGTSLLVDHEGRGLGVDARGWRPAAGVIGGPALPGVAGAVQAQHNMLVDLGRFPNARNLRRVLHSQAQVSHQAAKRAATAAPDLVHRFTARAGLYRELVRSSRNVGGLVGGGGYAVVESQNAASRLQRAPTADVEAGNSLHELASLCMRTDARIAATIEHGFQERLYFVSITIPRLISENANGVAPVRQRWVPVTSQVQTPLLGLVREQLRPPPVPPQPSPESHESRVAYDAVLTQQVARVDHARPSR